MSTDNLSEDWLFPVISSPPAPLLPMTPRPWTETPIQAARRLNVAGHIFPAVREVYVVRELIERQARKHDELQAAHEASERQRCETFNAYTVTTFSRFQISKSELDAARRRKR